ncbi:unnamed protein product [Acanthoscelides obtectus]|uniref:DDE Tnp4 domain-containing protein n=1 Tax=Acanthoscelides obtectus TaxID=200917 RepID=A0A9P0JQT5_ACAOB|nr:unnamed protein product [Acanthoscelides obtectus]CAK1661877.1 hypothetical protein AOBTE_LOCUS22853 [Acanthoscelides obtectus]
MTNFMTPYRQTNSIGYEEKCFNYRLCRARRVVENAFGIMANRFRIFLTPIATKVDTVDDIVMACCVLHNFLRRKSTSYIQPSNIDTEDIISGTVLIGDMHMNGELISLDVSRQGSPTIDAKMIRNGYKEYYNNAGGVDFQHKFLKYLLTEACDWSSRLFPSTKKPLHETLLDPSGKTIDQNTTMLPRDD